jgi:hypothetical protein
MNSRCLLFIIPAGMCCAWKAPRNSTHCTWLAGRVAVKLAHHALALPSNYWATNSVFWFSVIWRAQTWTRWCGANDRFPMSHLLPWRLAVGWPGIPHRNFMLDFEHCQPRCLHGWNLSRGVAGWCDDLSQGWRRRRVPTRLSGLGILTSITSNDHAIMQMTYH